MPYGLGKDLTVSPRLITGAAHLSEDDGEAGGVDYLPNITQLMSCKAGSTAGQPDPSLPPEVTVQMELLGIRILRSRQPWKSHNWAGRTK